MKWPSIYRGWDDRRLPVKLQPTWWAPWAIWLGVVLSVATLVLCAVVVLTDVSPAPGWIMATNVAFPAIGISIGLHERFDRLVPTRLHLGLCPKCFYRLDNLDREEDNATVCPECGAAWVLPGKAKKG